MPERDGKTEYGGAFLSQMKSRARSLYEQVFAEIYIEENEEHPEPSLLLRTALCRVSAWWAACMPSLCSWSL